MNAILNQTIQIRRRKLRVVDGKSIIVAQIIGQNIARSKPHPPRSDRDRPLSTLRKQTTRDVDLHDVLGCLLAGLPKGQQAEQHDHNRGVSYGAHAQRHVQLRRGDGGPCPLGCGCVRQPGRQERGLKTYWPSKEGRLALEMEMTPKIRKRKK